MNQNRKRPARNTTKKLVSQMNKRAILEKNMTCKYAEFINLLMRIRRKIILIEKDTAELFTHRLKLRLSC